MLVCKLLAPVLCTDKMIQTSTRAPERSTLFLLFLFNTNNRTTKGIGEQQYENVKAGEQQ
jgi:hypothetical protein